MDIEKLLKTIQDAAYEVRVNLCSGYLESVYQNALVTELELRGIKAEKEVYIPVFYKGKCVGEFRADLLVDNKVIVELKAVCELLPVHEVQLVNYLVATGIDYGILINFGGEKFRAIRKSRIYNPDHI